MTTTKGFITGAATTALDTRKADAAKLAANAAGVPRVGVLTDIPNIVTSNSSTAPMRVAVAKADFATTRGVADGAAVWTNDGSIFVTVTKPVSNSHYVVIYAKHNDAAAGDANSDSIVDVVTGTAAASPTVPAVPTGAQELARVLIPSTATATTSAGVVITNTYPMTAMRGGLVNLRDATEATAWTPAPGASAYRQDLASIVDRIGAAWVVRGGGTILRTSTAMATHATPNTAAVMSWNFEDRDDLGAHDNVTNPSRLTAPAAGLYTITAKMRTSSTSFASAIQLGVNGTPDATTVVWARGGAPGGAYPSVTRSFQLNAGDYVEVFSRGEAGGLTITPAECYAEMIRA
jgi:hypothetical protein